MSRCKGCNAEIVWALTENGKRIPLDATKEKRIVRTGFDLSDMVVAMRDTYMPHHAACPAVQQFRPQKAVAR